ncbi:hypothetical protein PIB30_025149 [Stylosanthes scabra]|uniref:Uncharacterized protein n=1 Tax=Stylosanthes scabra TaxID=79078 RepID=A0ABU6X7H8_9FABA|nr:hypothetical protein [Stylosanthes scabra]
MNKLFQRVLQYTSSFQVITPRTEVSPQILTSTVPNPFTKSTNFRKLKEREISKDLLHQVILPPPQAAVAALDLLCSARVPASVKIVHLLWPGLIDAPRSSDRNPPLPPFSRRRSHTIGKMLLPSEEQMVDPSSLWWRQPVTGRLRCDGIPQLLSFNLKLIWVQLKCNGIDGGGGMVGGGADGESRSDDDDGVK